MLGRQLVECFMKSGLRTSMIPHVNHKPSSSDVTLFTMNNVDGLDPTVLDIIAKSKIARSLVIITTKTSEELSELRTRVKASNHNMYFYTASTGGNSTHFHRVIKIKNKENVIIQKLSLSTGFKINENFDFEGLHVTSKTLPWAPHITFEDDASSVGSLVDVSNCLAGESNFTLVSLEHPVADDWGVEPASGPFNASGTWSGVMGGVINGDVPLAISMWVHSAERDPLVDFVPVHTDRLLLALTPQPRKIDLYFFLRYFVIALNLI